MLSPDELILLHELSKQYRDALKYRPEAREYSNNVPLILSLEPQHLPVLDSTIKKLEDVLENLQGLAAEATETADPPKRTRVHARVNSTSAGAQTAN